jgi:hypothetical protein
MGKASYSQVMWVLPDVFGLFSNDVGSFSDNLGSGRLLVKLVPEASRGYTD